jgi:hypothetical protein
MAKKAGNRRASDTAPVRSRNVKTSKNDGRIDEFGPLSPDQNRRVHEEGLVPSPNTAKRVRPDGFMDEFGSNRKTGGYEGSRAAVHSTPGVEAERTGDLIESLGQTDIPDAL